MNRKQAVEILAKHIISEALGNVDAIISTLPGELGLAHLDIDKALLLEIDAEIANAYHAYEQTRRDVERALILYGVEVDDE